MSIARHNRREDVGKVIVRKDDKKTLHTAIKLGIEKTELGEHLFDWFSKSEMERNSNHCQLTQELLSWNYKMAFYHAQSFYISL